MEMKSFISKSLESAMAQATFDTSRVEGQSSLKDCLLLQILSNEGSLAYRSLASLLESWQLRQVKLRLERIAYRLGCGTTPPDEFYKEYALQLRESNVGGGRITTIEAVADILADRATFACRIFALYNITAERFRTEALSQTNGA